jgi:hypothetical protein
MAVYTTIDNPELYFQVKTYSGTGSSNALTLDGDEDMQPDHVAIKQRSSTQQWNVYDSVRGVQKYIGWNTGILENTQSQGLTAFGSDGFTVGTDDMVNKSSSTYVAYCWKAGTSFTNDASATSVGNTDSNGTASSTAGFSICKYVGAGSSLDIQVKHGLSVKPAVMWTKNIEEGGAGNHWAVYHHKNTSAPETDYLKLSDTTATTDQGEVWHDTEPTSAIFTAGDFSGSNRSGDDFISYHWNEVQGFSKFGAYTGNGNADGSFIYLGFKPAWFLCKNTQDAGDNWILHDNKRNTFNVTDEGLAPNSNEAEFTDVDMDFLSNGVKMRNNTGRANASKSFIYMAFAESPFVNSNGVPTNAR